MNEAHIEQLIEIAERVVQRAVVLKKGRNACVNCGTYDLTKHGSECLTVQAQKVLAEIGRRVPTC